MIKKIKKFHSARYERKMIAKTKELLENQIKGGKYYPHYNHDKDKRENIIVMILFFRYFSVDAYFHEGKGSDVRWWIISNEKKVLELYDDLVSNPPKLQTWRVRSDGYAKS
ncbi:hypothetical protein [Enterococcus innesii]|nr:hypothetical protein [Enterococcus innesii]